MHYWSIEKPGVIQDVRLSFFLLKNKKKLPIKPVNKEEKIKAGQSLLP